MVRKGKNWYKGDNAESFTANIIIIWSNLEVELWDILLAMHDLILINSTGKADRSFRFSCSTSILMQLIMILYQPIYINCHVITEGKSFFKRSQNLSLVYKKTEVWKQTQTKGKVWLKYWIEFWKLIHFDWWKFKII
jgi:hypothetical protein